MLIIFLNFYFKALFFTPMERLLRRRYEATEGARKLAGQILEKANARMAEYETAICAARAEVYEAQERSYKQLQEQEAAQLAKARESAGAAVKQAKAELAGELEEASVVLQRESGSLADRIAESILKRSAA